MYRVYSWKPDDLSIGCESVGNFDQIQEIEPSVSFTTPDEINVLTLSATKLRYNRELFSSDSYRDAARRVFEVIERTFSSTLKTSKSIRLRINEWHNNPSRYFEVFASGEINHNYDLDHWHWWLIESLSELVKKKYNT